MSETLIEVRNLEVFFPIRTRETVQHGHGRIARR